MIENGSGDLNYINSYGGKEITSPIVIASITKLFTTACILILNEQKKLCLRDKICNYFDTDILNGLHILYGRDFTDDITIMHLISQTSGLPDVYEGEKNFVKDKIISQDTYFSFEDWIVNTKKLKPRFAPQFNKKSYYADVNFSILGIVLEKITSTPVHSLFNQLIFKPLGLHKTYLPTSENDLIPSIFYKDKKISRPKFIVSCTSNGGCVSTAQDLMTFTRAFFKGDLFDISIFNKYAEYRKLQFSMSPIRYGLGHMQIPLGDLSTMFKGDGYLVGHSGSTGSFAFYNPVTDLFFVGDINQMVKGHVPIRLSMQLSMSV